MGSLLLFVNAVTSEVTKTYPNVKIGTLAYHYSRKPPKTVKPHPNVQIQLCTIECNMLKPINYPKSKVNSQFCQDLNKWGQICGDISIWSYNTNFDNYLLPCPNLRVLEPNIRYFMANNVCGIFMQGVYNGLGGEFCELRNYVTSRLLWDPNQSGERLINEFLRLHYGKAAPPIDHFINLIHDNVEVKGIERDCFGHARAYGIDDKIARAGVEAFEEALRLADNAAIRARVEKASICAYRAAIKDAWVWVLKNRGKLHQVKMSTEVALRTRPYSRRLFELTDKYNVTQWAHNITCTAALNLLRQGYGLKGDEPL